MGNGTAVKTVDSNAPAERPRLLSPQELSPGPRQKRSIDKRQRLKAAALTAFGEKGYAGTSIQDITREARLAIGGFYQHFSSKRQLLLVLMDDLLAQVSQLDLRPQTPGDIKSALYELLSAAFSQDIQFLGAYRAWQEAVLSDRGLAQKNRKIREWTTNRVLQVFEYLQQLPGARTGLDLFGLARAIDSFFWGLMAQAAGLHQADLNRWLKSATHLIYHALFIDAGPKAERHRK